MYKYSIDKNTVTEFSKWEQESLYNETYGFQILNDFIWFIDKNGELVNFQVTSDKFIRFPSDNNITLQGIYIDRNQILWSLSSDKKLISIDVSQSTVNKSAFNYNKIFDNTNLPIIEINKIKVSNSWVWLSSEQGVFLYDKDKKTTSYFNENNGLANNTIYSIVIDNNENAWVSTNGAISVISPKDKKIKNFNKEGGVSDTEFLWDSSIKTSKNIIYFGGDYGFHKLFPTKIIKSLQVFK